MFNDCLINFDQPRGSSSKKKPTNTKFYNTIRYSLNVITNYWNRTSCASNNGVPKPSALDGNKNTSLNVRNS